MDGERIRKYFRQETLSMLEVYKNFELLIPATKGEGSAHKAEDGRFRYGLNDKRLPSGMDIMWLCHRCLKEEVRRKI